MKNILFNSEMTKAILNDKKTQTRRTIKVDQIMYSNPSMLEPDNCVKFNFSVGGCQNYSSTPLFINSKYKKDDIVWVREPARVIEFLPAGNYEGSLLNDSARIKYLADGHETYWDNFPENPKSWLWDCKGIPNGCCKSMARIFLKITDVRVERLQDISFQDMIKEGVYSEYYNVKCSCKGENQSICMKCHMESNIGDEDCEFVNLWNKTALKGGYKWEDNPFVFVYEFKKVEQK